MTWLFSDLWPVLLTLLAAGAGVLGWGARQKSKGRSEERQNAMEADNAKADHIRNSVERDLPDRLRDYDDAGWRD